MNGRIFRAEALRRHVEPSARRRSLELRATTFALLWAAVMVLVAVLSLLAGPVLSTGWGGG
ncbi:MULTISPECIES: hypothetical protein [unclassified Nonomuraea]|uniref:hypothetical protein n=1 Tax=unclassified Nonomuraea TaxID=2593643 RepID=UPI00340AE063